MPMYDLIEYSDNYSKTSGSLWQFYRDESSLDNNDNIFNLTGANRNSKSFKYKQKITDQTDINDRINVKTMVALKYVSNFWRTLETPLINGEINLILTWSEKCVIASNTVANQAKTFAITDTKFYVSVVTLSIDVNKKLLQQLKSGFKGTINWNKYQSKVTIQEPKP